MKTQSNDLAKRSALVRRLLAYREMLPGSLVFTRTKCGKKGCICADGERLHPVCQLVVRQEGKTRTIYVPEHLIEWVRKRFEMHKRFQADLAEIHRINLAILDRKKKEGRPGAKSSKPTAGPTS